MRNKLILLLLTAIINTSAQNLKESFRHPNNDCRMKTWWFFGYENTTDDGIHADVKALKDAGFGGVVYYDQNHRSRNQQGPVPDKGFSTDWWRHLKCAAREAHNAGLSFELNISNGYVAGGKWIDAAHAMQRVASASICVEGGKELKIALPIIRGIENYVQTIAIFAVPVKDTTMVRHITAHYAPKGKGKNGAMQGMLDDDGFRGYGFKTMPDIGILQETTDCSTYHDDSGREYCSTDSSRWHDIAILENMYSSQGGYQWRTTAFPAAKGRAFDIAYNGDIKLREWHVGPEALVDRWEEKSGLQSDFIEHDRTPEYTSDEVIHCEEIINLNNYIAADTLTWHAPSGRWRILRLAAVLTEAKSKHGRENLLGYECDKLSREAAELHWNSYVQVILDTLKAEGIDWVEGITMDSHEGGSQNWTPLMLNEFRQRRGYDLTPYLPILAGYVIDSKEKTDSLLRDYRLTLSDCIRDNYYATFNRLAKERGLTFTAQAIGNALCIVGDAVSVKRVVDKPQGEFWTYQQQGAYDVKDCSSAAHLYGKSIASAEAMTDAVYSTTMSDLKRVADIAFSFGAQEFVVCATPHIPLVNTTEPYVAGREYAINRSNPKWFSLVPLWEQLARTMTVLREGRAAPDVLVYLGDDVPIKTLTHRLPKGLDDLDWDVCTGDALLNRLSALPDGRITTPDSVTYRAIVIEKDAYISSASAAKLQQFRDFGVKVLNTADSITRYCDVINNKGDIVHIHRKIASKDCLFLANITNHPLSSKIRIDTDSSNAQLWRTLNGKISNIPISKDKVVDIYLNANESLLVLF